jgi:hypothetical protein
VAQGWQEPPQSLSVSLPFWIPSKQVGVGAAQNPAVQSPDWQSRGVVQAAPAGQEPVQAQGSATQLPWTQEKPVVHRVEQAPQLFRSVSRSTMPTEWT